MQTATPPSTETERRPAAAFLDGPGGLALLLIGAAAVFTAVSDRPLTHSELRYVEAGREMLEQGDWIVPHLSYVAYFEKPILTYWLEAASQALFGVGMVAVRVPFILACVAMTWTTYAFGRQLRGPRFGFGAAALLVASGFFQLLGPAPLTDPLFAAFLALAWYAYWRHDRAPRSAWIWAFWTALGFAVLTKGPLGLVLAGTAVGAYLLVEGRVRDFLVARPVRGTLVVVAINAPWWWVVGQRDPRYVYFFFVRENFEAFFSAHVNHGGRVTYYFELLPALLFPFGLLGAWAACVQAWNGLAPAVARRLRAGGTAVAPAGAATTYVACMFVAPLAFLTVSASKLATYLLPLLPALALLAAAYVADRIERPSWALRWLTTIQGVVLLAVAAAAPSVLRSDLVPSDWGETAQPYAVGLACAAAAMLVPMVAGGVAMGRGRVVSGMIVVAAGSLVGLLVALALAPRLIIDTGQMARQLAAVRKADERVVLSGPVSDDYAIVYELRARPVLWLSTRELGMGHFTEVTSTDTPLPSFVGPDGKFIDVYDVGGRSLPLPQNPWLVDDAGLRAAWKAPHRVWFVGRSKDVGYLRDNKFAVFDFAAVGDTSIVTNLPLPGAR